MGTREGNEEVGMIKGLQQTTAILAVLSVRFVYVCVCRWTKHGFKWSACYCRTRNTGWLSWNWSVSNISSLTTQQLSYCLHYQWKC